MSSAVAARRAASEPKPPAVAQAPSASNQQNLIERQKRRRLAMLEAENFADTEEGKSVARRRDIDSFTELADELISQSTGAGESKKSKREKFNQTAGGKGKGKIAQSNQSENLKRRGISEILAEQWPNPESEISVQCAVIPVNIIAIDAQQSIAL